MIVAVVALVIAIMLIVVMCGKKEDKELGEEKTGKETIELEQDNTDKKQSEENEESGRGLDVAGPDEADEDDRTGAVEFIGPDASGSGIEAGSENTTGSGNSGNSGSTAGNGNTSGGSSTDGGKEGNLDEETDNKSLFGDFF